MPATPARYSYEVFKPVSRDYNGFNSEGIVERVSTPKDYGVSGVFVSSDKRLVKAWTMDMTYREMADGVLATKPARWEHHYGELPTLEELIAEVPADYVQFYDPYDHSEGHPHPWEAVFRAHVLRVVKG